MIMKWIKTVPSTENISGHKSVINIIQRSFPGSRSLDLTNLTMEKLGENVFVLNIYNLFLALFSI